MNFIKKNKMYVGFGLLVIAIIFVGNRMLSKSNVYSSVQSATASVTKGTITSTVSASGSVESANYLAVTTSVNGIVKKVFVKEGDPIKSGQRIMEITLDSEGQQSRDNTYSAYLKAKNILASANNQLYTLKNALIEKKDILKTVQESNSYDNHNGRVAIDTAQNDYSKAKGDLDQQDSQINQLEIALNDAWLAYQAQSPAIVAPSDGVIANIVAVEGTQISNTVSVNDRSTKTIASIKKEGTPIASFNINELDINKIKVGQKAEMTLNSHPNKTFAGTVVGIDKIGSTQSNVSNYPVIVKFDETADTVLPNMGVEAAVILDRKENVLYVPTSAITASGGKDYVHLISGNGNKDVEVQTGIVGSENIEIMSGLNEGDTVLLTSLPTTGFTSQTQGQGSSQRTNNRPGGLFFFGR